MSEDEELPSFEGWETIEKLGEGGMCAVYRVRRAGEPDRALKVLFDKQPNAMERFAAEARLLMKIDHPNIVEVVDLNHEARPPWLVMEMLSGYDLEEGLEQGPMSPELAAAIFADVASGLAMVHDMGIMHRDIKPANIMMSGDGIPHLLDFGIARDTSKAHLTQQGFVVGTASYLPPEIFVEEDTGAVQDTPSSDVFALGQSMCEVLTGTPVHSREGAGTTQFAKIVKDKMTREFLDPREWRPQVPDDLAEIVIAATQAEPEHRIFTARAFEERLRDWLKERGHMSSAPVTRSFDPETLPEPPTPPQLQPGPPAPEDAPTEQAAPEPRQPARNEPDPGSSPSDPGPPPLHDPTAADAVASGSGTGGLAVSAMGWLVVGGGLLLVTAAGIAGLWAFRPLPHPNSPAAAQAVRTALAAHPSPFAACKVDQPGEVVIELSVHAGTPKVHLVRSNIAEETTRCVLLAARSTPLPPGEVSLRVPVRLR